MCIGPIRIYADKQCDENLQQHGLVLLLSSDYIHIAADRPYIAQPNEYDFVFYAMDTVAAGTTLSFWFPFLTKPMPMRPRFQFPISRQWLLDWHYASYKQACGLQDPQDMRSFNWDETLTVQTLGRNWRTIMDQQMKHIQANLNTVPSHSMTVMDVPLLPGHPLAGHQQHHLVTLKEPLDKGKLLYIGFEAEESIANPIPDHPYSGEALLYYYDPALDTIEFPWVDNPIRSAPVVPCVMQHVVLTFPYPVVLEPEILQQDMSMVFASHERHLPHGDGAADWRDIVVFNPHHLNRQRDFFFRWTFQRNNSGIPSGVNHQKVNELLAQINATEAERDTTYTALERLVSIKPEYALTPKEYEVAQLRASLTLTNTDIAQRLNRRVNTIEGHLRNIYSKLGFDHVDIQRKAKLLYVVIECLP